MKLTELVKKEAERTHQDIKFESQALVAEVSKKIFKKERVWLEEAQETIKKPLENQLSINNQETITQSIINQSSNDRQSSSNDEPIITQPLDKPIGKPSNNQSSINHQKTIKRKPSSIVGNEAGFLALIVDECSKNGALKTGRITTDLLKANFSLNANGIANLIFRVKEKGLVEILEQKLGRVSYRVFSVSKEVYDHFKSPENHQETFRKPIEKPSNKPSNLDLDSSSSFIKELEYKQTIAIPEAIKTLISQKEVSDLLAKNLLPEEDLKSCLEHFAYDYQNGFVRAKTSPINLLYGLIRAGKKYRSIKLLELENQELRDYETSLKAVETENERLKQLGLKEKYEAFKNQNPDFLEKIKAENKFIQNDDLADKIGFSKFLANLSYDT